MSDDWPASKAEFQQQLAEAWSELQQTLDLLTEAQMTERTDQVGWTVKDHLAHLIPWERGMIALLKHEPRYAAMGVDVAQREDEDQLNETLRAPYRSASLSDVRERLRETHEELTAVVATLGPDDLFKTYSHYQQDDERAARLGDDTGEPVLRWVIGNSSGHYLEHLPWIRQLAGGTS
jgi:uncharacterized protein (TIGR03083 family)